MNAAKENARSRTRKLDWPANAQTILVAEDEHLLARNMQAELEDIGYTVVGPAPNGRKAVELAREHRPDLALLDMRMPEMDGLEAGKIIYEELHIPIVVVSAYSDREFVDSASQIGVFGYLLKPVSLDTLRVSISVAWKRFVEKQELANEVGQLEKKLEERKVIERAKGLIMEQLRLSEADAMRRLQKQARDSRRPMVDLARSVIEAHDLLEGKQTS